MARPFSHPVASYITLDGLLHALADPARRHIIALLLSSDGMTCSATCEGMAPSTISHHYKILREAGLVYSRKEGVSVINTVRKADVEKHANPPTSFKRRFLWKITP